MACATRFNPLSLAAGGLDPGHVLFTKLVIVALLAKRYDALPEPGVGFLPMLDAAVLPAGAAAILRLLFHFGALTVLLNIAPRTGSAVVAGTLLTSLLWNVAEFAQSRLFASCLLLIAALSANSRELATLVRWQLVLLYGGAALNKLSDAAWWSGRFLDVYSSSKAHLWFYPWLRSWAGLWPAAAMSWGAMGLEAAVAVGLCRPRWAPFGVGCGLVLHTGILVWLGFDFDAFFYCVLAAYAAALEFRWPSGGPGGPAWLSRLKVGPAWLIVAMALIARPTSYSLAGSVRVAVVVAVVGAVLPRLLGAQPADQDQPTPVGDAAGS